MQVQRIGATMEDDSIQIEQRVVGQPQGEPATTQEQPETKLEALDPYLTEDMQEVAPGSENLETVGNAEEPAAEPNAHADEHDADVEEELPRSVQKRLNKMTREKREAEERAMRAEMLAQQFAQAVTPQQQQTVQRDPYAPVEPLENDPKYLGNDKAYLRDYVNYQKQLIQYEAQKNSAQRYQSEVEQKYQQRINEAREKYDDFDESINNLSKYPAINNHPNLMTAVNAIKELENGADVGYYLAKNANDFMALLNKNPLNMAMELGRLSGRVETAPLNKVVSNAPPPPRKIAGGAPPPKPNRHFADLSLDEMEAKFRSLS